MSPSTTSLEEVKGPRATEEVERMKVKLTSILRRLDDWTLIALNPVPVRRDR